MSSSESQYPVRIDRRSFLKIALAGAGALVVASYLDIGPFAGDNKDSDRVKKEELATDDVEKIKDRASELADHSEEALAGYLLKSEYIQFDGDYPRIRESMVWAQKEGVFPLVDPDGDINKGLENCSPSVPAQKPLLVLLALLSDAKIGVTITSLSTSSEHSEGSHHYQGRAADMRANEGAPELMKFVHMLNTEGIVDMDELSAPGNPGGYGLNNGVKDDISEGDHIHLSTKGLDHVKPGYVDPAEARLFKEDSIEDLIGVYNIKPATYFNIDDETAAKLLEARENVSNNHQVSEGIFPPSVMQWHESIESAAKASGVNANFIATLVTIESCGVQSASSSADAHGLIQIVPRYHRERIAKISGRKFKDGESGDADRAQYLKEHPGKSLLIGADFLKELVDAAREERSDLDPDHPVIYMRAAAAYNGGPKNIKSKFSQWQLESQKYANFVSAFYVDIVVADLLRASHVSKDALAANLNSPEFRYRMMAFREMGQGGGYADYSRGYRALEVEHPGIEKGVITDETIDTYVLYHLMKAGYDNYKNKAGAIPAGLPPALTFWAAHGGFNSLNNPANKKWLAELANY